MAVTTQNGSMVSEARLEEMAHMFERGEWPEGSTRVVRGRPLKLGEELVSVTFKIPASELSAMDARVKSEGISRSDYLRRLVGRDLAFA